MLIIEQIDVEIPVYDFTVENSHNFYCNGILVHNCGETILRDSGQCCNLSESIIKPDDTFDIIKQKVAMATIIGTFQSTLTNFRYLRPIWKRNAEEERLLGVSFTGIMDHPIFSGIDKNVLDWSGCVEIDSLETLLTYLRHFAYEINAQIAGKLGIEPSKHIGVVKPAGTTSLLTGTSSGIHPRYAEYYIRRVTQDNKDPLTQLMKDQNIPYVISGEKTLFEFPVKSPNTSLIRDEMTALNQLELWKIYKEKWCDGNPSQTIYYTDDEFFAIADWVWTNWDIIGGISFFPYNDVFHENMPLEKIDKDTYDRLNDSFPYTINWSAISDYEQEDNTVNAQEVACSGGACELV